MAFGGTVFNNEKDWLSNLRWFIPHHKDEYTQVVHTFVQLFCGEYQRRHPAATVRSSFRRAIHSAAGWPSSSLTRSRWTRAYRG